MPVDQTASNFRTFFTCFATILTRSVRRRFIRRLRRPRERHRAPSRPSSSLLRPRRLVLLLGPSSRKRSRSDLAPAVVELDLDPPVSRESSPCPSEDAWFRKRVPRFDGTFTRESVPHPACVT